MYVGWAQFACSTRRRSWEILDRSPNTSTREEGCQSPRPGGKKGWRWEVRADRDGMGREDGEESGVVQKYHLRALGCWGSQWQFQSLGGRHPKGGGTPPSPTPDLDLDLPRAYTTDIPSKHKTTSLHWYNVCPPSTDSGQTLYQCRPSFF